MVRWALGSHRAWSRRQGRGIRKMPHSSSSGAASYVPLNDIYICIHKRRRAYIFISIFVPSPRIIFLLGVDKERRHRKERCICKGRPSVKIGNHHQRVMQARGIRFDFNRLFVEVCLTTTRFPVGWTQGRKETFEPFQSIKRMNHGQQQSIHGRPGLCVYCLQDYFFLLLLSLRWRFVRAYCCRDMLSRPTAGAQQPGCEFQHIFFIFFFFLIHVSTFCNSMLIVGQPIHLKYGFPISCSKVFLML